MKFSIVAASLLSVLALTEAATTPICEEKYSVTSGDTCQSIATKYGITEAHLKQWNKDLKSQFDCSTVKEGDSICVKYVSSSSKNKRGNEEPETAKLTGAKPTGTKPTGAKSSGKPRSAKTSGKPRSAKTSGKPRSAKTSGKPRSAKTSGKPRSAKTSGKPRSTKSASAQPTNSNKEAKQEE